MKRRYSHLRHGPVVPKIRGARAIAPPAPVHRVVIDLTGSDDGTYPLLFTGMIRLIELRIQTLETEKGRDDTSVSVGSSGHVVDVLSTSHVADIITTNQSSDRKADAPLPSASARAFEVLSTSDVFRSMCTSESQVIIVSCCKYSLC